MLSEFNVPEQEMTGKLNQASQEKLSILHLLLLYKENMLKKNNSAGGLPNLFFRKSQEELLSHLKPEHASIIAFEYHGEIGYLWHDFALQTDYNGLRRIFHTLNTVYQNKALNGGKLQALKTLCTIVDYRFKANTFTYWIEFDSIKGNSYSLFFTPRDRTLFKNNETINKFAWCLSKFNLKNKGFLGDSKICHMSKIATITNECGGFVAEIGYLNRGEDLQHIKLLIGKAEETEDPQNKYNNDIMFMVKLLSTIKEKITLQVLAPCLNQINERICACNPQGLFASISVYSSFISLEIEVYPPIDTRYVDNKESMLNQCYIDFWDKIMDISELNSLKNKEFTRYTKIGEIYSIEDKWVWAKFTRAYLPNNNHVKLYRQIRILSQ